MAQKPDIRSFSNPFPPSYSQQWQAERLTGEVYSDWDALLRSVREGSTVEVAEGFLLAPINGKPRHRRDVLLERIDAVKARGGVLREASTGHRSDNRSECNRMLLRAFEMIASSGRGRHSAANGARSKGRPRKQWSKEQLDAAERIWFSRRYKTRQEATLAIQALGIPMTKTFLYAHFGVPNQAPGDPSEIAKIEAQKPPRKRRTYVYFIRNGTTVKIGHSASPRDRMRDMGTSNHATLEMLAILPGGVIRERALHKKFAKHRIKGEWFNLVPQITKYLASLKQKRKK